MRESRSVRTIAGKTGTLTFRIIKHGDVTKKRSVVVLLSLYLLDAPEVPDHGVSLVHEDFCPLGEFEGSHPILYGKLTLY